MLNRGYSQNLDKSMRYVDMCCLCSIQQDIQMILTTKMYPYQTYFSGSLVTACASSIGLLCSKVGAATSTCSSMSTFGPV